MYVHVTSAASARSARDGVGLSSSVIGFSGIGLGSVVIGFSGISLRFGGSVIGSSGSAQQEDVASWFCGAATASGHAAQPPRQEGRAPET